MQNENLRELADVLKGRLTERPDSDDVVPSEHRRGGSHGGGGGDRVDGHGDARELSESGGSMGGGGVRGEQAAVEGGGGGERRGDGEEGGEREGDDGAAIPVAEDAAEGEVVGGTGVAEFKEGDDGTEAGIAVACTGGGGGGVVREV
jgi:hypothetical protein